MKVGTADSMTKLEEFLNNEEVFIFALIGWLISYIFMVMMGYIDYVKTKKD